MPADVNVTEKVAKRLFASPVSNQAARTAPEIMALCDEAARDALSVLADPEVQAGIAGALYRLDNPGLPWEQVREDYLGLAEVYMRRAAAVVEWLRGRAL